MSKKIDNKNPEIRANKAPNTELRVSRKEGEPVTIEGYSIVYDIFTDMGWYDEKIRRGAAKNASRAIGIPGLVDHRSELIIGRTGINIEAKEDENGVFIRVQEPKVKSQRFDQLAADVESGLITGQSFAFYSNREKEVWTNELVNNNQDVREKREIVEIKEIADFSFVTYPAYPDTTAAKRSLEIHKKTSENRGVDKDIENDIDDEYVEYENLVLSTIKI